MRKALWIGVGAIVLAYLSTGLVVVQPNEKVIVRRFGRAMERPLEPGLSYVPPWGLAVIDRVLVDETKQITIGAKAPTEDMGNRMDEVDESAVGRFLTGDQNLLNLAVTVQYSVSDPKRYLLTARDPDWLIASATEALLTEMVATKPVDEILLGAQLSLGDELTDRLQRVLDERLELGVRVRSVNFTGVAPPVEVADAFNDVVKARSDKQKRINDAYSYAGRTERQARAKATQLENEATAYAHRRHAEAMGQSQQFLAVLAAYGQSSTKSGVARRLFLETIEEVLPRMNKVIVGAESDDEPIDLSILRTTPE